MVATKLIQFLYPPEFSDATIVLQLIIAGNAVGYLGWILYTFLITTGRQTFCMWNSLTIGVGVLSANLLLVPHHGYHAVAVIQMTTDVVLFASMATYVVRQGYLFLQARTVWKIIFASSTMGVALFLVKDVSLIAAIVVGIAVYGTMILALRGFGDQEREIMAKVLQR